MNVGGIQAFQEVTVTITLLKILEVEAGAYCLKVPSACIISSSEDGQSDIDIQYSLRVEINTQHRVYWVSVPYHSKVAKVKRAEPQAGHFESILIEKLNASTKNLKKDLIVYFRTAKMDRP